jgi:mannose-6-phosphate isomerase-like protein (cupin superfamily)
MNIVGSVPTAEAIREVLVDGATDIVDSNQVLSRIEGGPLRNVWKSLAAVLAFGPGLLAGQSPDPAVYVDAETVAAAFANGGSLAEVPDARIMVLRRNTPGRAEVHETETDIFYVVEGAATIVTGGRMVDSEVTAPGQIRGSRIEGGIVRQLRKGDFVAIPAGTPHWFSEVPESINYLTIKALGN